MIKPVSLFLGKSPINCTAVVTTEYGTVLCARDLPVYYPIVHSVKSADVM